ncbi:MAG: hypothetical protein AB9888_00235 [Bacteroidales bacterium]
MVFQQRQLGVSIEHDYDQRVKVAIRNEDSVAHTLQADIRNPNDDLIVNFVDSGSSDQSLTLQPGEARELTLALHAQDAKQHSYTLTARTWSARKVRRRAPKPSKILPR